jgi:hypothetical protein
MYFEFPSRPALTGGKKTTDASFEYVMEPLIKELMEKGILFPRTILYADIKRLAQGHKMACKKLGIDELGEGQLQNGELTSPVVQYHAAQGAEMKTAIVRAMKKKDGKVRLVLATEAFGLGTDSEGVRQVIFVGPPNTIETLIQAGGRAGRDGQPARLQVFFNASDISANKQHMSEEMRTLCKLKTCRRDHILAYFGYKNESKIERCCDNCLQLTPPDLSARSELQSSETQIASHIKKDVLNLLINYFNEENNSRDEPYPDLTTGLSKGLATIISEDLANCNGKIAERFQFLQAHFAETIESIIQFAIENSNASDHHDDAVDVVDDAVDVIDDVVDDDVDDNVDDDNGDRW